jgi:uncharacterized repeat protein (TIGR01451 family)
LGVEIPVNVNAPEWKQIGTVINTQNNSQITVQFFSEGEAVIGNDYVIDDVSLQQISVPIFTPVKSSSTSTANVGDIVTYTVQLTNTCTSPLTNVFFKDTLPIGLLFVPGSVTVNGASQPDVDPNTGFPLPDIQGAATAVVTFQARVEGIPDPNPTNNVAAVDYSYTPVDGGIPEDFSEESNQVPLLVVDIPGDADIGVMKQSDTPNAIPGQMLTYTMIVSNTGPADAENVLLTDDIPADILNPQFSTDNGVTFQPWTGSLNLGTVEAGGVRVVMIRGTVNPTAAGVISNTATVTSPTPDPNPDNNTSTIDTPVLTGEQADVSIIKTANPNPAAPGEMITFTLTVSNAGPSDAENVIVNDNISLGITGPVFSTDGGETFNPWPGFLNVGTLAAGESRTVIINGTVSESASGCINNTAVVVSATPDPDLINNVSSICVEAEAEEEGGEADISVEKIANKKEACFGELVEFTIVVSNAGPDDALEVVLIDSLANLLQKPAYSLEDDFDFQPWPGSVNLGTIPAGSSRVVLINGWIRKTCACTIINTAHVSSITPDPDLHNNTATAKVQIAECCDH